MRGLVVLLALAGCIETNTVRCADGSLCPEKHTCDDVNHRCIGPGQLSACDGLEEGARCSAQGIEGTCTNGVCEATICGDGVRAAGELCEGSDLGAATCLDAGYYTPDGLACTQFCTFDVSACSGTCGDLVVNGPELCDGAPPVETCLDVGYDAGPLACSGSCGASFEACARFGLRSQQIGVPALGIGGPSSTDLWVVGLDGRATHFENNQWVEKSTGVTDHLTRVEGTAADNVWAIGASTVLRWDGAAWQAVTAVPSATYRALWVGAPDAVLIGTQSSGVLYWNGATWSTLGTLSGEVVDLDAASIDDVYAALPDDVMHWNGATWTPVHPATAQDIDVIASDNVWIAGREELAFTGDGVAAHWNGQGWTTHTFDDLQIVARIAGSAANEAWITAGVQLRHYDGTRWARVATGVGQVGALVGFGAGDFAAASFGGFVHRFRGQMYTQVGPSITASKIRALWSSSGSLAFVGMLDGTIHRYDGATWTPASVAPQNTIRSLWGAAPDDVWAVAGSSIYRFDGISWSPVHVASVPEFVWGTGPTDVWVLGGGIDHFDGTTWTSRQIGTQRVFHTSGSAADNLWVVTQEPTTLEQSIWRWNGTAWVPIPDPPQGIRGIVTLGPDNAYAITRHEVHHFDGTGWTGTLLPSVDPHTEIAASAPDDVVIATASELFHFDGSRWSPMRAPRPVDAASVEIAKIAVAPDRIVLAMTSLFSEQVWSLLRIRPWVCRATETGCTDGIDDDCDGAIDGNDSDCP